MKRIALAFYWHMHQPYYVNPVTGIAIMPWVRMHATRGYFDLISLLDEFPGIRQTFNFVPSLLQQIEKYNNHSVEDLYLQHSAKPAAELTHDEKQFILWNFFMVSWDTMLLPHPRYKELLYKRGTKVLESSLREAAGRYTERDFRDLQVWFNLAWFGFRAAACYPELAEMKKKGAGFSEAEKARLLAIQADVLRRIIPLYKGALERGQVELTTSPFYHPIMPLVYDTDFARRALPDLQLPQRYRHPEDVEEQLASAVRCHERVFGRMPIGLWPPEGAVCPEIVPIVAKQGIRWMASDEDVLFRSVRSRDRFGVLYRPYLVEHDGSSLNMVFRDRELSDKIGFSYARTDGRSAAADLLLRLTEIAKFVREEPALVSVILDGENAWQTYSDGGEAFLRKLYEELSGGAFASTVTLGEYLSEHPPREAVHRLHSGSWINSDYAVWIGEQEDNAAWELLGRSREAVQQKVKEGHGENLHAAMDEIYAAEGSDWFWWYGEQFTSDNDAAFDELFRTHLKNAYLLLGAEPPESLDEPIMNLGRVSVAQEPKAFLKPILDGRESSYYEWVDAGRYDPMRIDSAMWRRETFIRAVRYGFDEKTFYLRIDPLKKEELRKDVDYRIHVHFIKPRDLRIAFSLNQAEGEGQRFEIGQRLADGRFGKKVNFSTIAIDRIVELGIPFRDLGCGKADEACFYLQVKTGNLEWERHPRGGYISFTVPDEEFEMQRWTAL